MFTSKEERTLVIGNQSVKLDSVIHKMQQDIAFLSSRIEAMKKQHNPNQTLLMTYESMLESRNNVLQWVSNYSPDKSVAPVNNCRAANSAANR